MYNLLFKNMKLKFLKNMFIKEVKDNFVNLVFQPQKKLLLINILFNISLFFGQNRCKLQALIPLRIVLIKLRINS